jgi:shikimate kinase
VSARVERAKLFCIRSRLTAAHKSSGRLAIKLTIEDLKNRGDTIHLDVEAAIPSRNIDKDSSRRILRKVTPVDLVNSRKHIY